ncbi:MAG: chondroitinase-B domain-containing protein [Planctomycetota bacterium]|jgi:hypothetical protein
MKHTLKLTIIFCLLTIASLHAEQYFVSVSGSDTNDGLTRQQAFLTIQKGVDALKSGDTLTILPGEYFGFVRRKDLGSMDKDTVIKAEIPGTVLVRGDIPAGKFTKVEGTRFTHVTDFQSNYDVQMVNEIDSMKIFDRMPKLIELEFLPAKFYQDKKNWKIYISTSDMKDPENHTYSFCVIDNHGLYFNNVKRLIIDGINITGFNTARQMPRQDYTLNSTWGLFIVNGKNCVIRNCKAYLNGQGIGLQSDAGATKGTGDNVIDNCTTWANKSDFGVGDRGGLTVVSCRRDVIQNSLSFLNGHYGANFRGGNYKESQKKENIGYIRNNIAWGNGSADYKIKTGVESVYETHNCVGGFGSNHLNPVSCTLERWGKEYTKDNIFLQDEENIVLDQEFADPLNHDYRLQETSRFRKAGPGGKDRGAYQYTKNIYYVSPSGNDSNSGLSVKECWKTLSNAVRKLKSGDTLYLLEGNYSSNCTFSIKERQISRRLINSKGKSQAASIHPLILPTKIYARGKDKVTLNGKINIRKSENLEIKRISITKPITLSSSTKISFENCNFAALNSERDTNLKIYNCVFKSPEGKVLLTAKRSSGIDLRGNLFDNKDFPALSIDEKVAVLYANYNSFTNGNKAWQVGKEIQSLSYVKQFAEKQSQETAAEKAVLSAAGYLARPFGNYRYSAEGKVPVLTVKPEVYSVTATTVNIEWAANEQVECMVSWGETPQCKNKEKFGVNYYATYSLTGLTPGKKYYFKVDSLQKAFKYITKENPNTIHKVSDAPLEFTTVQKDAAPAIYYVSPAGDNKNDGLSKNKSWKTIQYAADKAKPGDTVYIADGIYEERIRIRNTGDKGKEITFKAAAGERPLVSGANKKLGHAFIVGGKSYLKFDGLYFKYSSREPLQGWPVCLSGEFNIYKSSNINLNRCFSDGRGGYSARFVTASWVKNLEIKNCVTMNKMSGAIWLWRCPEFRLENSIIARPLISLFTLNNTKGQPVYFKNNIFTDMLKKKAKLNIGFSEVEDGCSVNLENNAFYIRDFTPETRKAFSYVNHALHKVVKEVTIPVFDKEFHNSKSVFADPQFAVWQKIKSKETRKWDFYPDRLMYPEIELDFDSFFTQNEELKKRGIGLQVEAFKDYKFEK